MSLTVAQAIEGLSDYTVGMEGDITPSELLTLQALVAGDVLRMNPGYTGDDLVKFESYLVLDAKETKSGGGFVTTEKVKDNSYTVKPPSSSSHWMDKLLRMISDFQIFSNPATSFGNEYDGVERADIQMPEFSDGYLQPIYGSYDDLTGA